ncbi:malto-oligosyltrehalose synthase [Pedobacter frigidisoli]|uniref:4-alpha-glucanotransferase n=1 Tax=Pedobacter frigidisoli TaxID=2530455 RepID=A0A4R0NZU4_9SPHI|nr:malto-oligosyltrehalose synthase [Pedobacter frigidisoli]TCD08440.1 malto-oligosyltrehalose synthase [Pedobacter frigidisoli]
MFKPNITYRIQFHKDFNFKSFNKIIPYLKKLGIDTIYASPIFAAIPGSTHGYDVINPLIINPEIGTEAELFAISEKLKKAGISWLQDIVPNHMAYHPKNMWLKDVLKNGEKSEFASFFDIDFSNGGKVMVPFLGDDLENVIKNLELKIIKIEDQFYLNYAESNWPINASSLKKLAKRNIEEINKDQAALTSIAKNQYYRLCNSKETNSLINYRRFFTVNSLICLNIQDEKVFNVYHEYIFKLIKKGIFQGLRIDHIDGLYDPKQYLDRLKNAVGDDIYIVVEKILESDEQMPQNWKTKGSTGYDFLAITNNLFTNNGAKNTFNKLYKKVIGKDLNPQALIHQKKTDILFQYMQGELHNLFNLFVKLNLAETSEIEEIGKENMVQAIGEMLIQMPIYRYYNYDFPLEAEDQQNVERLLKPIIEHADLADAGKLLWQVLLENPLKGDEIYNQKLKQFYQRCMQFTGPLMAKGVEDTVMFTYNRFVGHTEVGDAPDAFGYTVEEFHEKMIYRKEKWPLALNGSSTHDTKKGEDVRARLNVLTDIPEELGSVVSQFFSDIQDLKKKNPTDKLPHQNDLYLIFQTILGALPMPGEDEDNLKERLAQYIEKVLREAKKRSDWAEPDENYEQIVKAFADKMLNKTEKIYATIDSFLNRIADFGIINSLAQLVLKFTCPGVPDVYQGTDLWDLSLVDPDNRRPVNYKKRADFISELKADVTFKHLWEERYSGKIKLRLTQLLINFRKENSLVFEKGDYFPIEITGKYAKHIIAFARKYKDKSVIVILPLGLAAIAKNPEPEAFNWLDTQIILPKDLPTSWKNMVSGNNGVKDFLNNGILVNQIFSEIPISLLELKQKKNNRSAGILMHITSLPSAFGIGDLGIESKKFVDFLNDTKQKYWQILPINPTKAENGHSPYSSNSAMAGNILLISPSLLVDDGLLNSKELENAKTEVTDKIDFPTAEKTKRKLLAKAYQNFLLDKDSTLRKAYDIFCENEKDWLYDFAIYTAIKKHHQHLEWYNWPNHFKKNDPKTVSAFSNKYQLEIDEVKWQQFIFYKQWHQLKEYANGNGVEIIGDLPFYLDHDSVEVWSHPELFMLDQKLNPEKVAGVPPDYFNEKGQLWGMPIFNWKKMKADNFNWWIKRLKKNMELFDLLRLDHFRAFSSYWEIPAGDTDAINGTWKSGVGEDFFRVVRKELGELPFIAEDLGEISEAVTGLRDHFKLPGMKVLQFAFGADLVSSIHIPHNYETTNCVVYSGTHDNNTLKGWFDEEIDEHTRDRISAYFGIKIGENNINEVIARLIYASSAKTAILPIQDVLSLGENARMNVPGTASGNWLWRLAPEMLTIVLRNWLSAQTEMYGRSS